MRLKILFIGHSYHTLTKSSEFFINLLKSIGEVTMEFDACPKGRLDRDYSPLIDSYDMVVVWQMHQVIRQMAEAKARHDNIIFVPMYDAVYKQGASFWKGIGHIKIVCFSAALRAVCLSHRLDSLFIQYYPEAVGPVASGYESKRMFFWQRRNWPNWQTLTSILPTCQFEKIHHHVALDPGTESTEEIRVLPTPLETSQENFSSSVWYPKKSDLIAKLREFNVFFLPREREGIGFSFLDAMAIGLIPVGFDQPTFNEYVVNGINGVIVEKTSRMDLPELSSMAAWMEHYLRKGRANYERQLQGLAGFLLKKVSPPPSTSSPLHRIAPKFMRGREARKPVPITASRRRYEGDTPLVSIITIVKDDAAGFSKTHQSVCRQTFRDYEYIVVDGASRDKTIDLIRRHEDTIDFYTSGNDNGPYDAMMKGASSARGRYVLFMNAGDVFAEEASLEDALMDAPQDAGIIYGHHYDVRETHFTKLILARDLESTYRQLVEGRLSRSWQRGIPPRQSVLVEREWILKFGFDSELRVVADQALLFNACARGVRAYHSNTVISKRRDRGISEKMKVRCIKEWQEVALRYSAHPDAVAKFIACMK
jgi:hypothetical protein